MQVAPINFFLLVSLPRWSYLTLADKTNPWILSIQAYGYIVNMLFGHNFIIGEVFMKIPNLPKCFKKVMFYHMVPMQFLTI